MFLVEILKGFGGRIVSLVYLAKLLLEMSTLDEWLTYIVAVYRLVYWGRVTDCPKRTLDASPRYDAVQDGPNDQHAQPELHGHFSSRFAHRSASARGLHGMQVVIVGPCPIDEQDNDCVIYVPLRYRLSALLHQMMAKNSMLASHPPTLLPRQQRELASSAAVHLLLPLARLNFFVYENLVDVGGMLNGS